MRTKFDRHIKIQHGIRRRQMELHVGGIDEPAVIVSAQFLGEATPLLEKTVRDIVLNDCQPTGVIVLAPINPE